VLLALPLDGRQPKSNTELDEIFRKKRRNFTEYSLDLMRAPLLVISLSVAICLAGITVSEQSVILPAQFGQQLVQDCGHVSPIAADISGYWSPTTDDAKQMEQALPTYLKHSEVQRPFADYYRQYVGIVVGSKRLVFVSAFTKQLPSGEPVADWTDRPVTVCGGSTDAWRVAFDPQTKQFSHWDVNGPL
jgi:hypothetical protein